MPGKPIKKDPGAYSPAFAFFPNERAREWVPATSSLPVTMQLADPVSVTTKSTCVFADTNCMEGSVARDFSTVSLMNRADRHNSRDSPRPKPLSFPPA